MGSVKSLEEEPPFPLTDTDRYILSLTDEQYKYHDWAELQEIIATNNLSILKRKPSDLRKYMKWTAETKAAYGNMTNFLMANRLPKAWGKPPFTPESQIPFAQKADYSVLINDWPYGLTPDITHIVVWTRTIIPTNPETGDVTTESRRIIQDFVDRYFVASLGPGGQERVMWFKNWVALQSVRSLEHIHVMVRGVSQEILQDWTRELECHRKPEAE